MLIYLAPFLLMAACFGIGMIAALIEHRHRVEARERSVARARAMRRHERMVL